MNLRKERSCLDNNNKTATKRHKLHNKEQSDSKATIKTSKKT